MSQPELNTAGATHFGRSVTGHLMFAVNPLIPVGDALEHASILQNCANKLMTEASFADATGHAALSAAYLGEMAKAILDDVAYGLSEGSCEPNLGA